MAGIRTPKLSFELPRLLDTLIMSSNGVPIQEISTP
jgi:hypothetical protein